MASYSDLASSTPALSSAGAKIQAQVQAEGAQLGLTADQIQDRVSQAQGTLANAYDDLANQFGIDPETAADYALKASTAAHTVVGAVDSVSNLVKATNSGSPQAVVAAGNAVVGTVVGLATTLGAVSAGTGALIVAGVALAAEALDALLGGPPVATVCGTGLDFTPNVIVGCAYSQNAQQVSPGSPLWRHFPEPGPNPDWFAPPTKEGAGVLVRYFAVGSLGGSTWGTALSQDPSGRLIDYAFSHYKDLITATSGGQDAVSNFRRAHLAAWKTNNAYSLNGGSSPTGNQAINAQPDYLVFLQTVRAWNLAHADDGVGFLIPMSGSANPFSDALVLAAKAVAAGISSYELAMVTACVSLMGGSPDSDLWLRGTSVYLHTGAAYSPPRVSGIPTIGGLAALSTTSKVLLGGVIVGGVGTALYAHATGRTLTELARDAWEGLKRL